jgi:hypothetical protein
LFCAGGTSGTVQLREINYVQANEKNKAASVSRRDCVAIDVSHITGKAAIELIGKKRDA